MRRQRDWRYDYEAQIRLTETPRGAVRHLTIKRRSGKDGIPWDVLQRIKNEMLGEDCTAVEVYPPQREVVNEVNMRHLWDVDELFGAWPLNMRRLADWS
jgi:hypothetical protein